MAEQVYYLTEKDKADLKRMFGRVEKRYTNPGKPFAEQGEDNPGTNVFVAKTPNTGIPAAGTDPDLGTPVLGYADCYVYKAVQVKHLLWELQAVKGLFRSVMNFGPAIPGDLWALIEQDRFGQWYIPAWTSTGGNVNTCTAITFDERDTRCESGIQNVYKRVITVNMLNGCLVKTPGSWLLDHQAGCCECPPVPAQNYWCLDIDETPLYWCLRDPSGVQDCWLLTPQELIDKLNTNWDYIAGGYADGLDCANACAVGTATITGTSTAPGIITLVPFSCFHCCNGQNVPATYAITVTGTGGFDGTYELLYIDDTVGQNCHWENAFQSVAGVCGGHDFIWDLFCLLTPGGTDLELELKEADGTVFAIYTLVSSAWDCQGTNTMNLTYYNPSCGFPWPVTLDVTPVSNSGGGGGSGGGLLFPYFPIIGGNEGIFEF